MKLKRALLGFLTITVLYLAVLVWVDAKNQVFTELPKVLAAMPTLIGLSLISYFLRYLRWRWLLQRAGNHVPWITGFLAYLSGFAFTATPGKVGELVRVRYFQPLGVARARVIAAFIYERSLDLIAVLLLATLAIEQTELFVFVLSFVLIFLSIVVVVASKPHLLGKLSVYLRFRGLSRLSRLTYVLREGLSGCRMWMTILDSMVSLLLGLLAWSCITFSFVWLLAQLNIAIPIQSALAIYPLAMLAGAASMLPGGVGSTEITIVALLAIFSAPLELAALAAIAIRFSTLWLAVVCGILAVMILEIRMHSVNAK